MLKKGIVIIRDILGVDEGNTAAIHLKNMFNIIAPGFFKNLIFYGGPNVNPGVISIIDGFTLNSMINIFDKNFSSIGITVERSEIRFECNALLMKSKLNNDKISTYIWLVEWMDKSIA